MECGSAVAAVTEPPVLPLMMPITTKLTCPYFRQQPKCHKACHNSLDLGCMRAHLLKAHLLKIHQGSVVPSHADDGDAPLLPREFAKTPYAPRCYGIPEWNTFSPNADYYEPEPHQAQDSTSALQGGTRQYMELLERLLMLAATHDSSQTQPPVDHPRRLDPLAPPLTPVPSGPNLVDFPDTDSVPSKQAPSPTVFPRGNVAHMAPIASGRPRGRRTFARRPDLNRHSRVADTDRGRAITDCHHCHRATRKPQDNWGSQTLSSEAACHSDNSFCDAPKTAEIGLGQLQTSPVDSRPRPSNSEKRIRDWNQFAAAASMWLALPDLLGSFFEWSSHQPCPEPGRFQPTMMSV